MSSDCCYFVDKAATADAAPALKYFGSILHCSAVFTQNLGQTLFHFGSDGRFLVLSAFDLCFGSIGVVLAPGWTTIDFVTNALTGFAYSYRFRALFGSEIAAVSVDNLLLSCQKFCHHTDVVFVGGCNFQ